MTHDASDGLLENALYGTHTGLYLPTVKLSPVVRREQIDVTLHRRDRTTRTRHGQAGTKVGRTSPSCTGVLAGVISNGGTVTGGTKPPPLAAGGFRGDSYANADPAIPLVHESVVAEWNSQSGPHARRC